MPGLTATEYQDLLDDMRLGPYYAQPWVKLLDLDHDEISDLSDRVIEGQVDCKLEGAGARRIVTRSANVVIADPSRTVPLDGTDASTGSVFYDKMLATGISFRGPRIGRWVTIPTSVGPVNGAKRSGYRLEVTTDGKERLALGMVGKNLTLRKGSLVVDNVRSLLTRCGEDPARISLPGLANKLPADISVKFDDNHYNHVKDILAGVNRQGFYDARGTFRMRSWPGDYSLTFRTGEGGTILTRPEVNYPAWSDYNDGQGIFNGVRVTGVKVGKTTPEFTSWLPAKHPLSPESLARRGVPYRLARRTQSNTARNVAQCRELADREVNTISRELVTITCEVMPNWLLEPGDLYAIATPDIGWMGQTANEFSLPLLPGAPMSLGANKYVARPQVTVRKAKWPKAKKK